jgi:two-component system response regulator HydG
MTGKSAILVVDDDFAHRTMLKTLIGGWGYEVREADDGATAVEAVAREPFDLVPDGHPDGARLGDRGTRGDSRVQPALPVILMTAYASVETPWARSKEGAYDYLTKPLDFDELRLALEGPSSTRA